ACKGSWVPRFVLFLLLLRWPPPVLHQLPGQSIGNHPVAVVDLGAGGIFTCRHLWMLQVTSIVPPKLQTFHQGGLRAVNDLPCQQASRVILQDSVLVLRQRIPPRSIGPLRIDRLLVHPPIDVPVPKLQNLLPEGNPTRPLVLPNQASAISVSVC